MKRWIFLAIVCTVVIVVAALIHHTPRRFSWKGEFYADRGCAKLETDRFTIVFKGLPIDVPTGMSGKDQSGSFEVSGSDQGGGGHGHLSTWGRCLDWTHREGVTTIVAEDFTVRILDSGTRLEAGGRIFDLTPAPPTIVLEENGTATAE